MEKQLEVDLFPRINSPLPLSASYLAGQTIKRCLSSVLVLFPTDVENPGLRTCKVVAA